MIRIEITGDAHEVRWEMRNLLGDFAIAEQASVEKVAAGYQRDLPETAVVTDPPPAEPPKAEPEVVPPKRTRAKKEAPPPEKAPESEITDIDQNGDPVAGAPAAPGEFDGMSPDEIKAALKPLAVAVIDKKGQEAIYTLLSKAQAKDLSAVSRLPMAEIVAFAAAMRAAVA